MTLGAQYYVAKKMHLKINYTAPKVSTLASNLMQGRILIWKVYLIGFWFR